MSRRILHVVRARGASVARALRLEEGLFRHVDLARSEWLTLVDGVDRETVVLGTSSDVQRLVDENERTRRRCGLVRRFSGGGTVLCDSNTLLIGMVMRNGGSLVLGGDETTRAYPRDVMRATGDAVYGEVFDRCGTFATRENDYVFGEAKFGGNAQAMTRGRFLHHTSFLYDYDARAMASVLKTPERAHEYRRGRSHGEFVTRLRERGYGRDEVFARVRWAMERLGYELVDVDLEDAERVVEDAVRREGKKRWDTVKVLG